MTAPFNDDPPLYSQVAGERLFSPDPFRPASTPPVEDWSVGGDLDTSVPDPTPEEITDRDHPDYVEAWWPE